MKDATHSEKVILHEKFKRLRNKVNSELKKDTIRNNNERIDKANDENEVWKIVKEISSPNRNNNIILNEDGIEITDGKEVAEIFNNFFIQKIEKLKDNIDISIVEDPLERLRNKMQPKNLKFSLQTVTEAKVLKAIKQMKNKKSAGRDEITQEQMIMGAEVLAIPLTRIINASITEGKFPDIWKSAVVTPVLKKGSSKDKTNYRPVSCLSVLSKVLEKIVCTQITKFMEDNKHYTECSFLASHVH